MCSDRRDLPSAEVDLAELGGRIQDATNVRAGCPAEQEAFTRGGPDEVVVPRLVEDASSTTCSTVP